MRHPSRAQFDIEKAARNAGIEVVGDTIVFDDECQSAVLMDNFLCDYRPEQKSVAETCVFAAGELTPLEAEWQEALIASRTSLFIATATDFSASRILFHDLLFPDSTDLWITDIGFAGSFREDNFKPLVYTRVISLRGINLTGGYSFIFDPMHRALLVDGYRKAFGTTTRAEADRRRTRHFLRQNRLIGEPQTYADVPPPSP